MQGCFISFWVGSVWQGNAEIPYIRLQSFWLLSRLGSGVEVEGVKSVAQNLPKHLGASTCWCKWEGPVGRPGI